MPGKQFNILADQNQDIRDTIDLLTKKGKMGVREVQKLRVNDQFSMMFPMVKKSDP